jgi:hypothetical protein
LRTAKPQPLLEFGQFSKVREPYIAHIRAIEYQKLQVFVGGEVLKAVVVDIGIAK